MSNRSASASNLFVSYKTLDISNVKYGEPKQNTRGGKNVPIKYDGQPMRFQCPLTFNWGASEMVDDQTGVKKYSLNLQLDQGSILFNKMQEFEDKIMSDALKNSKEWFGKSKMSADVIKALAYPILKYPKNKETQEPDLSRNPTVKVKLPYWEGKFNIELYDMNKNLLCDHQDEEDINILDLIPKASHVSAILECGGVWFAAGRFGVTFKFILGKVRPPARIQGYCLMEESDEEEVLEQITAKEQEDTTQQEATVDVVDSEPEEVEVAPVVKESPKSKTKVVRKKKKAVVAEQ